MSDPLPSGLTPVSAIASQGSYDSATSVWTVGDLAAGIAGALTLTARVESPNAATNTATVTGNQSDPDPDNNSASATVTPQQANLAVAKIVSDPTPNVGDTITFRVFVGNHGPDTATNVALTDTLPAGLTFVAAAPSEGTYNPAAGVWTVRTLPAGRLQTLAIRARVVSPDPRTNTVSVTHSDQFDPNTNNNSGSVTVTPQQADLAVTKTVDNAAPNVGDTVTFTISVTNHGPNDATGVTVTDPLTAGFTFVSAIPDQGTYDATTGLWNVGDLANGQTSHLAISAQVAANAETNTASVAHSDQFDPDHSNNTASLTIDPLQADLAVAKTVSKTQPTVGDNVVFTVVLTNKGPNAAIDVTVLDPLPSGLTFVSATPSQGTYTSSIGLWTVGTVTPGTQQTLKVTARVASQGSHTNTASVAHSDQFDPDPSNNSSSAIVTTSAAPSPTSTTTTATTTTTTTTATTAQTPSTETSSALPITGADLARLLLPALAAISIGLSLVACAGKRRRWSPRHRAGRWHTEAEDSTPGL